MSSTSWDFQVTVNVSTGAAPVRRRNFGLGLLATTEVDVGFTELYRLYESNSEVQADDDLKTAAKAAGAIHYSQPAQKRPRQWGVAKVTYDAGGGELLTSLNTLLAAFDGFYGICCASRADADQEDLAEWALANERIAIGQTSTAAVKAGTGGNFWETLNTAGNNRGAGIWADDDTEFHDVALLAQGLAPDLDQQSSVWYDTQLKGLTVPDITVTERNTLTGYGGNILLPKKGIPVISKGTVFSLEYIDVIVLGDWFKARCEEAIVQLQLDRVDANSKIPFTNYGIELIVDKIREVYGIGVAAGHFRDSSLELDVPDISEVSTADLSSRSVTLGATIIRAGAIQNITLNVGIIAG